MISPTHPDALDAVSLLPSITPFIWTICAKVLGRFLDASTQSSDSISASIFRSEIQVFR